MAGVAEVVSAVAGASLAGGSGLGVIVGALGSVVGRVVGIFEAKQRRVDRAMEIQHEAAGWQHDLKRAEAERLASRQETEDELKISAAALEQSLVERSYDGLKSSIEAQSALAGKSYPWVDAANALMRPGLTVLLFLALLIILLAAKISPDATSAEILRETTRTLRFAAETAMAWWFGERMMARAAGK